MIRATVRDGERSWLAAFPAVPREGDRIYYPDGDRGVVDYIYWRLKGDHGQAAELEVVCS